MSDITASIRALPDPRLLPMPEPLQPPNQSNERRLLGYIASAVPVLGLGAGAYVLLRGSSEHRSLGLSAALAALGLGVARWQLARFFTEQSPYEVELSAGAFEVRRYEPSARAETVVDGLTWSEALNEGFHRVAGYIFGNGQPDQGTQIAMTAPVTATLGTTELSSRTVSFTMPKERPLSTLPAPTDSRVRVRYVPARRVAALRFSGRYGGDLPAKKAAVLLARVREAGLHALGEVTFAGYDAPWTVPWLRRNEVLVDLAR